MTRAPRRALRALERLPGRRPSVLGAALPPPASTAAQLERAAALLGELPLEWRRLAPHLGFAPDRYRRCRIGLEAGWEVVLCCWLPGQRTPLHGHGASMGVVRVLAGTLCEARFVFDRGDLVPGPIRSLSAGGVLQEGRQVIHVISNEAAEPAVSLHLYCPPLGNDDGGEVLRLPLEPQRDPAI